MLLPQAGSDEVGTGDTFGPIVVVCSIVDHKNIQEIEYLNIKDSKELNDEQILKIAPELMKKIKYSYRILNNNEYNIMHLNNNLNKIKAILHNEVYIELKNKNILPKTCIVDAFCSEKNYYDYIKDQNDIYDNLILETKAENKYISVAVASIIARYIFIREFDKLKDKYNIDFKKGSSNPLLNNNLNDFIDKYGLDELKNVAKLNFKNVNEVINKNK